MEAVPAARKAFGVKEAIQLVVETAARAGIPLEQSLVLNSLCAAFPHSRFSNTALEHALKEAADDACVTVHSSTKTRHSTGVMLAHRSAGVFEPLKGQDSVKRPLAA